MAFVILQACLQSDSSHAALLHKAMALCRIHCFCCVAVFYMFLLIYIRVIRAICVRYQIISAISAISAGQK